MSDVSVRYVVKFTGQVQGVGFRATSISLARDLDVHGFVRNEPDGSVTLDVDGPKSMLVELVERIKGRMSDRIDDVQTDQRESRGRSGGLHIG